MTPFLFGFPPTIENSPFMSIEEAIQSVGGNTGNLAFCYAINRVLGGGLTSVLWHAHSEKLNAMGGIGILALANQLGPHTNLGYLKANFNSLNIPLVGVGLGAQTSIGEKTVEVPVGTLDWIRIVQEKSFSRAPNIGVRGDFSLSILESYGLSEKAITIGCPTLFISPEKKLGKIIADKFSNKIERIAVAAGHQQWKHLSRLEASLVALSQITGSAYICQSPAAMIMLGRGHANLLLKEQRDACRLYAAPEMSDTDFIEWTRRYAISFFSTSAWLEYLRRFDFVVGTRIHGVMLALQVGIPALCIAHDSRTMELCQTMKVPYVKAQEWSAGITRNQLISLFKFDPDEFDDNRILRAKIFSNFLISNGLIPDAYLLNLIT